MLLACLGAFLSWRRRLLSQVLRGSEIAETAKGRVEFARVGTGPVILNFHGGATGYDQTLALSWNLHQAGFAVLTPSRPGYLRTPLVTGPAPEQAADAVAGLLDVLGLDKVGVIGTSGGGATALQFALRHPERVWGLVLQSAVTQRFIEPRRSTHSLDDLHQYAHLPVYPLEQITCPTLVLHGRADGNVPFAHAQFVARTVPKVQLLAIEDCGHLIWVGPRASQAREQVLAFLRQHAPPPANPPQQKQANLK